MKPASMLVVDDHPAVREALRVVLESAGHQVRTAEDGPEALAAVADARPDLVLLDLRLLGMSGGEVCDLLRHAALPLPVILMSMAPNIRQQALVHEATGYLQKPFDLSALLTAVELSLEQ